MEFFTDEIFTKPNVAPFVMIASTNGGKTMIGIDIFHECLKAGYNQMNFITSSMNSKNNDVLRNNILKYCVVEDRADICRALNEIHAEQNSITIIQDEDVIAKGEKMMTATERDQVKILKGKFMTRLREHIPFITNEVCRNNDECAAILAGLNQKETPEEFYNILQMER